MKKLVLSATVLLMAALRVAAGHSDGQHLSQEQFATLYQRRAH